jgi:hypothetical protein
MLYPRWELLGKQWVGKLEQAQQQVRTASGTWAAGVSGNPSGRPSAAERRQLVSDKVAELAVELGGIDAISAHQRSLLETAAGLLLARPRANVDSVRTANAVARCLRLARRASGRGGNQVVGRR